MLGQVPKGLAKKNLYGLLGRDYYTGRAPFLSANQRLQSSEEYHRAVQSVGLQLYKVVQLELYNNTFHVASVVVVVLSRH